MLNKIAPIALSMGLLFSASGCSTISDAQASKGSGSSRIYEVSFDKIWETIPVTLNEIGLKKAGDNKAEGYVTAQGSMSLVSYGENVAIFVEKLTSTTVKTRVEVVSKKVLATNVFATNWEKKVLDNLSEKFSTTVSKK